MNLETTPAHKTICTGSVDLLARKYFPCEGHRTFMLEATHGPKYKSDCNSCQAGVTYIKQAFEYLNKGTIVWNENIIEQTQDRVVVLIGDYRRELQLGSQKVCVVPVEPTVSNLTDWFVKQFKGQLELAHVNSINISSEEDATSLYLGY